MTKETKPTLKEWIEKRGGKEFCYYGIETTYDLIQVISQYQEALREPVEEEPTKEKLNPLTPDEQEALKMANIVLNNYNKGIEGLENRLAERLGRLVYVLEARQEKPEGGRMNKQQITQEEFDKKVEALADDKFNDLEGFIDKGRLTQFAIAQLKERYEIK